MTRQDAPPAAEAVSQGRPLMAFTWMLGAIASFTLMAVAGRAVQVEMSSVELMAWRSVIGIVIVCAVLAMTRQGFGQIRTAHPGLHLQRNVIHFIAQNAWFMALMLIPLAQLVAIEFTSPIWVALLAPLILGERMTVRKAVAVALGFTGVLIVARPGVEPLQLGHLLGLVSAVGFALNAIWTRRIMAHDTVLCVLFWMTVSQAIMGFLFSLPGGVTVPSAGAWPWMVLLGVVGLTAHYSLTSALTYAPVSLVAPMEFLRLPVITLVGAMVYGEAVALAVFLGGGLILLANLINLGVRLPRNLRLQR